MIKIEVAENGSFKIDGAEKTIADLSHELIEEIVEDSLSDEVDYTIEGELPIAIFFATLRDGTAKDSELRILKASKEEEVSEEDTTAVNSDFI